MERITDQVLATIITRHTYATDKEIAMMAQEIRDRRDVDATLLKSEGNEKPQKKA